MDSDAERYYRAFYDRQRYVVRYKCLKNHVHTEFSEAYACCGTMKIQCFVMPLPDYVNTLPPFFKSLDTISTEDQDVSNRVYAEINPLARIK